MMLATYQEKFKKKSTKTKIFGKFLTIYGIFGPILREMWNVFDRPVDIRITNVCEGWNSGGNKTEGSARL